MSDEKITINALNPETGEEGKIEISPEVVDFAKGMLDTAPATMTNPEIVWTMAQIMLGYITNPSHAIEVLNSLGTSVLTHLAKSYEDGTLQCECPKCVEKRRREAH